MAAAVGFVSGLPVQLVTASCLVAMIWFDPVIGVWLTIAAIAAVGGFILGVLRKPHPVLYRKTSRDDGSQRISHLEAKLAQPATGSAPCSRRSPTHTTRVHLRP
jgi:hypothetical protein